MMTLATPGSFAHVTCDFRAEALLGEIGRTVEVEACQSGLDIGERLQMVAHVGELPHSQGFREYDQLARILDRRGRHVPVLHRVLLISKNSSRIPRESNTRDDKQESRFRHTPE